MTQVASADNILGGANNLELSFNGRQHKLERTGNKVFTRNRRLGETEYGPAREVVLLTGSHTLQILWTETGQGRRSNNFRSPTL